MAKQTARRTRKLPADVVRCVQAPDGRVVLDLGGKIPVGKDVWVGVHPDVWERMVRYDAFSAWFGQRADASQIITQGARIYREAAYHHLSLAQKAKVLVLGYEDVMRALEREQLGCVIIATDAGASDAAKVRGECERSLLPYASFGERTTLGSCIGRRSQVFLGVRSGTFAEKIVYFIQRNTRFMVHLSL